MKKLFAIALLAVAFAACTSTETKTEVPGTDTAVAATVDTMAAKVDTMAAKVDTLAAKVDTAVKAAVK